MTVDTQKLREQATDAVAEALGDAYDCTRVWSAWGYGTMRSDDFCLVTDDESRLAEITQAALNPAINVIEAQAAEIERLRQLWVSVAERLPEPGVTVFVYSPPQPEDWPDSVRIEFDAIDPESDGGSWVNHSAHYEHFCCVAKGGMDVPMTGPSEKAPYTHWMPVPAIPAALSEEPT